MRSDDVEWMTNNRDQAPLGTPQPNSWDHVVAVKIDALERVIATISTLGLAMKEPRQAAAGFQSRGAAVQASARRRDTRWTAGFQESRLLVGPGRNAALPSAPACGTADYLDADWLTGWAHGPCYTRTHVELRHAGAFLCAWPAERPLRDLWLKGIGDGAHGFRIPLFSLLGGRRLEDVVLTIAGTDVVLPLPMKTSTHGNETVRRAAYDDASTARLALLAAIRPAASIVETGVVRLSLGVLQQLLNALSAAEARAAEQAELGALLAARNGPPSPERPPLDPPKGAPSRIEQVLRALIAAAPNLKHQDLVPIVASRLTAPLQALPAAERSRLLNMVMAHGPPVLLQSCGKALQQAGFIAWPAEATEQCLRTQDAEPTLAQARLLMELRAVSHLARREPALPMPHLRPRRGTRRLYALWRSVPHDTNGYATRSHYLLRALLEAGEDVIPATRLGYPWDGNGADDATPAVETVDGVPYLHLGGATSHRKTMTTAAYIRECGERIAQVAAAAEVGLIHAASNWMIALPALHAARLLGVPFCYEVRGLWEITRASHTIDYKRTEHYRLFERMEGFVARQADLTYAITPGVRNELGRRGVDTGRVRIAPNGCDTTRFTPQPPDLELAAELGITGQMVFGYIGSFVHYEGIQDLCQAAVNLHGRGLDFRLILVGDGPDWAAVKSFCDSHEHGGKILLLGRVPFQDVPRYYSLIKVAAFPRKSYEITEMVSPLKPFEAMAMGKPVIGSDVAAIADIIRHGDTGWLFPKDDVAALTAVMEHAIAAPEVVARLALGARGFIEEHHDWRKIAARIAEGWHELSGR